MILDSIDHPHDRIGLVIPITLAQPPLHRSKHRHQIVFHYRTVSGTRDFSRNTMDNADLEFPVELPTKLDPPFKDLEPIVQYHVDVMGVDIPLVISAASATKSNLYNFVGVMGMFRIQWYNGNGYRQYLRIV